MIMISDLVNFSMKLARYCVGPWWALFREFIFMYDIRRFCLVRGFLFGFLPLLSLRATHLLDSVHDG